MRLRCPHCGTLGSIRSSEVVSATVSRQYVICNNLECGHTWRATTEADLTLSPSATPESTVLLPMSSHVRRDVVGAQMRSARIFDYSPRRKASETRDLFHADGPS